MPTVTAVKFTIPKEGSSLRHPRPRIGKTAKDKAKRHRSLSVMAEIQQPKGGGKAKKK